jgi:nucleoside-diphosphate-sugar epimerase
MLPACSGVTHAFFSSYIHRDGFEALNVANHGLFKNFLDSLLEVAPNLECCLLQTGGKHYNVHLGPVPSPAREEEPRRDSPIGNFYYQQEDYLFEKQQGATWRWNVVRPEAIIGATPKPNGMNEALTIAFYFIVCKEMGIEAKMPSNKRYWDGHDDASDARLVADLSIWASTHPHAGNQAFNVTNGDYFSWRYMWPRLAAYFGASASSEQTFATPHPTEGGPCLDLSLSQWSQDKRQVWERICHRANLPEASSTWDAGTWAFQDWVFQRTWCATLSMNKAREFGWTGYMDSYKSFTDAFKQLEKQGVLPKSN